MLLSIKRIFLEKKLAYIKLIQYLCTIPNEGYFQLIVLVVKNARRDDGCLFLYTLLK